MVTHDPDIAQQAQRIIYIRDGKIEKEKKRGEHHATF
jgi:ABC-type lipoprotein export system ATPase subunit